MARKFDKAHDSASQELLSVDELLARAREIAEEASSEAALVVVDPDSVDTIDDEVSRIAQREAIIEKHLAQLRAEVIGDLSESTEADGTGWLEDAGDGLLEQSLREAAIGKFDLLEGDDSPLDTAKVRRYLKPVLIGLLAIVATAAAIYYFGYLGAGVTRVPDLIGLTTVQATATLKDAGLSVGEIVEEENASVAAGTVLNQDPKVDVIVTRGSTVRLIVAGQSNIVAVPNVAEMTPEEARAILNTARLSMEEVPSYDALTLEGDIIGQLPVSETLVEAGSTVSVLVSLGPPGTLLPTPRVMGLSEVDAIAVLQRAGFMPLPSYAQTTYGRTGEVVAQTPATGALTYPGAPVQFLVSTALAGADSTVPDVVGMREENAVLVLEEAGFNYLIHPYVDSQATTGTVVAQMPLPADMQVRPTDVVELLVVRGNDIRASVPNVLGMNLSTARETLREYGFRPITVPLPTTVTEGDIYQQFPAEGSDYYIGLPVLLYAGRPAR